MKRKAVKLMLICMLAVSILPISAFAETGETTVTAAILDEDSSTPNPKPSDDKDKDDNKPTDDKKDEDNKPADIVTPDNKDSVVDDADTKDKEEVTEDIKKPVKPRKDKDEEKEYIELPVPESSKDATDYNPYVPVAQPMNEDTTVPSSSYTGHQDKKEPEWAVNPVEVEEDVLPEIEIIEETPALTKFVKSTMQRFYWSFLHREVQLSTVEAYGMGLLLVLICCGIIFTFVFLILVLIKKLKKDEDDEAMA